MRLNLGCGHNQLPGYINVDTIAVYQPDVIHDLEQFPWPWEDNSVEEIILTHTLEHLGSTTEVYFNVWKEIYRVCKNNAVITITVPHWLHENFVHDPTHVRIVTPIGVALFDNERNVNDFSNNGRESKLGLLLGIDFKIKDVGYAFTPQIKEALMTSQISQEELSKVINSMNNVCEEIYIIVQAIKPARNTINILQKKLSHDIIDD